MQAVLQSRQPTTVLVEELCYAGFRRSASCCAPMSCWWPWMNMASVPSALEAAAGAGARLVPNANLWPTCRRMPEERRHEIAAVAGVQHLPHSRDDWYPRAGPRPLELPCHRAGAEARPSAIHLKARDAVARWDLPCRRRAKRCICAVRPNGLLVQPRSSPTWARPS